MLASSSRLCLCLLAVAATTITTHGFMAVPREHGISTRERLTTSRCWMSTSTKDESVMSSPENRDRESLREAWMAQLQSQEIQDVRKEVVAKYISMGKTEQEAEVEVDKFLSDPEQSLQYLEMRRSAVSAKSEGLVGPELIVQIGGSIALGVGAATIACDYFRVSG